MRTINDDVGDPWRLTCPECHSYDVRPLYTTKKKRGNYTFDGNGKQRSIESRKLASRSDSYRCNECGNRLTSVYDKKQEKVVPIASLEINA